MRRYRLLWLLVPYVLFLAPLPWVNVVEPTVGGVPFLMFWIMCATLATPFAILAAGLRDER
ncbi:DUF3311 domain-containing protein [Streptomyces sp. IBSNAI002]|uniref:DUF3311 domain-containing protein n=1 Tax=Streptomyces sp. IBSNAI002 TaxID=3457500 RepID=UPI003FD6428F